MSCVRGEGQKGLITSERGSGSLSANNPSVGSTPSTAVPDPGIDEAKGMETHPFRAAEEHPFTSHCLDTLRRHPDPNQPTPHHERGTDLPERAGVALRRRGLEYGQAVFTVKKTPTPVGACPVASVGFVGKRRVGSTVAYTPLSSFDREAIARLPFSPAPPAWHHVHPSSLEPVRATPAAGSASGVPDVLLSDLHRRGGPRHGAARLGPPPSRRPPSTRPQSYRGFLVAAGLAGAGLRSGVPDVPFGSPGASVP